MDVKVQTHSTADVALLFRMWAAGATLAEIGERFGVVESTVSKWVTRYKLPRRWHVNQLDLPAPTPEDDAASLAGLALSPWVEERAREVREKHYAERRAEPEETARSKANAWRRGVTQPRGAHHDKL